MSFCFVWSSSVTGLKYHSQWLEELSFVRTRPHSMCRDINATLDWRGNSIQSPPGERERDPEEFPERILFATYTGRAKNISGLAAIWNRCLFNRYCGWWCFVHVGQPIEHTLKHIPVPWWIMKKRIFQLNSCWGVWLDLWPINCSNTFQNLWSFSMP